MNKALSPKENYTEILRVTEERLPDYPLEFAFERLEIEYYIIHLKKKLSEWSKDGKS